MDESEKSVYDSVSPHTIKKFEIIEAYVKGWAYKILGYESRDSSYEHQGIIFIDCMSNCGSYIDKETGLPVVGTAIRVARVLSDIIKGYKGKKVILYFNDIMPQRVEILKDNIHSIGLPREDVEVHFDCMDCNAYLRDLYPNLIKLKRKYNILLLYDPYEATIDWEAISLFFTTWGEVIINHMEIDTRRSAKVVKRPQKRKKYESTYQLDMESIVERMENSSTKDELNQVIKNLIERYGSVNSQKIYIASFPFFNRSNGHLYNLFHCSHNEKGFVLFKKIAWETFGDKSSMKNTHGFENQMEIIPEGEKIEYKTHTDSDCYYVKDIALDLCEKYKGRGDVEFDEVYSYLRTHPIFPCDGYKEKIKRALREQGVVVKNDEFDFRASHSELL